ncbi:MAG: ribonuclease HII, partial [Pseudoleptotrichia goodfellowii]|nr:ribonuclease HII [Pseudoleptotrichia goodfellowii]
MGSLAEFDNSYNKIIVGVDEAGRGPLAGPVVAAAVIIIQYFKELDEINDSKKLSEKKREQLFELIKEKCIVGTGIADEKEIDEINILNATFSAMRKAI